MGRVTGSVRTYGCEWLQYDYGPGLVPEEAPGPFTMWRYRHLLPMSDGPVRYPLPIGGTPLLPAPALRDALGTPSLWVKDETRGPTASNKDRATALVIEDGLRHGLDTITTASTGNAAVATAFGAAAAGMRAAIFVSIDCQEDKLALMTQAGAWVFQVPGGYAAAVDLSRAAVEEFGWVDRNTGVNPLTTEAKKTVALEVWEQLGRRMPDVMVAPVGDGPTLAALEKGFAELVACGVAASKPRLVGVQARACQPLVRAWQGTDPAPDELDPMSTAADGIAVLRPAIGDAVLRAVRSSDGAMVAVSESELMEAVGLLASTAGVGAEPAGAASVAGLRSALREGLVDRDETVVVLVTGREIKAAGPPSRDRVTVADRLDDVRQAFGRVPLPIQSHQFVAIRATIEQTEE